MIRTLAAAIPDHPALGRVNVPCRHEGCDHGMALHSAGNFEPDHPCGLSCDPATILTCDRAEEVGEMAGATHVCPSCGVLSGRTSFCHCATGEKYSGPESIPVTARLFLWTGEKVEIGNSCCPWEDLIFGGYEDASRCTCEDGDMNCVHYFPPLLAAVVLVGQSCTCSRIDDPGHAVFCNGLEPSSVAVARAACAEASVQFVIPGDPEKGRLEL